MKTLTPGLFFSFCTRLVSGDFLVTDGRRLVVVRERCKALVSTARLSVKGGHCDRCYRNPQLLCADSLGYRPAVV
ncbi:unnamed protein product [Calypogeia fissa]